jgi:hypothetical protein
MHADPGSIFVNHVDHVAQVVGRNRLDSVVIGSALEWLLHQASPSADSAVDQCLHAVDAQMFVAEAAAHAEFPHPVVVHVTEHHVETDGQDSAPPSLFEKRDVRAW